MLFTSNVFILFFLPLLFVCYFAVPKKFIAARNFVLLLFSIIFYGWGGVRYLGLLVSSICINYIGGYAVHRLSKPGLRRTALIIAVALNLGLLGVFKYTGFVTRTLAEIGIPIRVTDIILPIGISFFTFQGMSYVIDVYRGDAAVQKNPLNVALYVALFPQLVAGPIVRYTDVEREIGTREHSVKKFSDGAVRFMLGFGKKMLMANAMGSIADDVFGNVGTELLTTPVAWVGIVAYTFQIYFDFSAYSDMAIGLGLMFGFHFNENFNYPYISRSVTEFWRRWHISLSTWFRDYVYIPLGGNRCSVARHIFNLFTVWMLTGLWHGAAWNFVLWGVYYGILLILEKYVFAGVIKKIPAVAGHILTILIVMVGWVFFRAPTLSDAASYISVMFGGGGNGANQAVYFLRQYYPEFILCIIGIFPLKNLLKGFFDRHSQNIVIYTAGDVLPKVFALGVFALSYVELVSGGFNPFIYFQF